MKLIRDYGVDYLVWTNDAQELVDRLQEAIKVYGNENIVILCGEDYPDIQCRRERTEDEKRLHEEKHAKLVEYRRAQYEQLKKEFGE